MAAWVASAPACVTACTACAFSNHLETTALTTQRDNLEHRRQRGHHQRTVKKAIASRLSRNDVGDRVRTRLVCYGPLCGAPSQRPTAPPVEGRSTWDRQPSAGAGAHSQRSLLQSAPCR